MTGPSDRRRFLVAAALLLGLVAALYARTATGDWRWAFDDVRFIVDNRELWKPRGVWELVHACFTDMRTTDPASPTGIVRPLRTLQFALLAKWVQLNPSWFHTVSVVMFAASSVLLLRLLTDLLGDVRAAFVGAALWALHPMQTECVCWVTSQGDLGMGLFVFLSLLFAVRSRGRDASLGLSLAAGLVAMLYKEAAVVLPLLVVAVHVLRARRDGAVWRWRDAVACWPWALLAYAYWFGYRMHVQIGITSHVYTFVMGGSDAGTLATMSRAFAFVYPLEALLPVQPAADWYLPPIGTFLTPDAIAATLVLAALVLYGLRRLPAGAIGAVAALLFFAPLLPVSNFPFQIGIPTAERFLHLPLVGLALLAAHGFRRAHAASPRAAAGAAAVLLASLGGIAFVRSDAWRTDLTLWPPTQKVQASPRAEGFVAAELRKSGFALLSGARRMPEGSPQRDAAMAAAREELTRGLAHARRAIELWLRAESRTETRSHVIVEPSVNAASIAWLLDRWDESLHHARNAVLAGGDSFPKAYYNLAWAWLEIGRGGPAYRASVKCLDLGMGESPGHFDEFSRMLRRAALLCEKDDETESARAALRRASAIAPDPASARTELRDLDARVAGRIAELRARAGSQEALAVALAFDGQLDEADRLHAEHARSGVETVAWIHARHEARPDGNGLAEAVPAYDALAAKGDMDAAFRAALCREALLEWDDDLAARFEKVAASGRADEPRAVYARRALVRMTPDVPAVPR